MPRTPKPVPPLRIPTMIDTPLTPRQEKFVLAVARGLNISDAYREAGYTSRRNATFTLALPNVRTRLEALKAETLAANRVSIDEIVAELREIVSRMQAGATVAELNLARRALMDLARICGLFSDRGPPPPEPVNITAIRRVIVAPDGTVLKALPTISRCPPIRGL